MLYFLNESGNLSSLQPQTSNLLKYPKTTNSLKKIQHLNAYIKWLPIQSSRVHQHRHKNHRITLATTVKEKNIATKLSIEAPLLKQSHNFGCISCCSNPYRCSQALIWPGWNYTFGEDCIATDPASNTIGVPSTRWGRGEWLVSFSGRRRRLKDPFCSRRGGVFSNRMEDTAAFQPTWSNWNYSRSSIAK